MATDPTIRPTDVRMKGFARRWTVEQSLEWVDGSIPEPLIEHIQLEEAASRVLAEDICSTIDVPHFARAMMDGFAVLGSDTAGASAYNPLTLRVIGESLPGNPFSKQVTAGHAVRIMTGAPMPLGADAVLPVEQTVIEDNQIMVQGEVAPEKHVGFPGEDIQSGTVVLQQFRRQNRLV